MTEREIVSANMKILYAVYKLIIKKLSYAEGYKSIERWNQKNFADILHVQSSVISAVKSPEGDRGHIPDEIIEKLCREEKALRKVFTGKELWYTNKKIEQIEWNDKNTDNKDKNKPSEKNLNEYVKVLVESTLNMEEVIGDSKHDANRVVFWLKEKIISEYKNDKTGNGILVDNAIKELNKLDFMTLDNCEEDTLIKIYISAKNMSDMARRIIDYKQYTNPEIKKKFIKAQKKNQENKNIL